MKITRSGRNVGRRTVAAETGPGRVPGVRDGTTTGRSRPAAELVRRARDVTPGASEAAVHTGL